jgi:polar amino acid transport system substrate-binding protein
MKTAFVLIGILGLASPASAQHAITFATEVYPPFTYRDDDGSYRGAGIEQVEAAMRKAGVPFTMEIMPWARAIALAELQPMHCAFAAARTPEREPRFKWIAPLARDRNFLVRHAQSTVAARTIEEAKRYTIGTHRADYTEHLLREEGFPSIDLSADFQITLNKLLGQRIDMMPMSEGVYETLKADGEPLEAVIPFSEQQLAIACNAAIPDEMIDRMQQGLDALISSKGQDSILERHNLRPLRLWEK